MKKIKTLISILAIVLSSIAYAQPGITVATAGGSPGAVVPIAINYLGTGSTVVGVQADVNFDSGNLTADLTNCGGSLGGTTITCTNPSAGVVRLTGFSLALAEISSGSLGTIDFTIAAAVVAPANFPITITGEVYSDAALASITPVGTANGQVNATAGPVPIYTSNPADASTLTFASAIVAATASTQTVDITNTGALGSTLAGVCALSGADAGSYTINSGANYSVAPGAAANTVTVQCNTVAAGTFNAASLDCTSTSGGNGSYPLSCTVTAAGQAQYASTPADGATIAMVAVVTAAAPTATLDITNPAPNATDNNLDLETCTYTGNPEITVTSADPLTAAVAPVSAATETVAFSCNTAAIGSFTGSYDCPYSTDAVAGPEGTATYTVNCDVTAALPVGSASPMGGSTINITSPPGGSGTGTVTFIESGGAIGYDVTSCSVTGPDFSIAAAFPLSVPASGSAPLTITFTDPGVAGPFNDTLVCTSPALNGGAAVNFPLVGTVQAVNVPTLSWMGYMAMMLGLLLVGFFGFRRRA